jgi:asparagine N-glycosylation enzyme membrane subunit Stt3
MDETETQPARTKFTITGEGALVLLILAGALFLRLYGIDYGLPFSYHVDEKVYSGAALNLGRAKIGPQTNPTGFTNILFLEYAAYFVLGKISGLFPTVSSYEQLYRTDPSSFLLLARITSAILGTLNVLVIYLIGSRVFGKFAGLFSALFLAFMFLHVRDSHYAVPDSMVTFLISLCLWLCVLSVQKGSLAYQYLAAAAGGYAIATKWNVFPILLPLALTHWVNRCNRSSPQNQPGQRGIKPALLTILALAAAFILGAFQLLIKPGLYLEYIQKELSAGAQGGFYYWQVDTIPGWLFYLKTLWIGAGFLLTVLSVVAVFYYLFLAIKSQRVNLPVILLSFPLAYFFIMGASRHYFARYVLPLLPFAALFSAALLSELYARLERRQPRAGLVLAALLALAVILPALAASLRSDTLLARTDTRNTAKAWIEANIPAGARIAMDWPVHAPYLATPDEHVPASTKEYVVTSFMDGTGLFDHPLTWYQERGYQYLIATSFIYQIPLVDQEKNAARLEFYRQLDRQLELVKEFKPNQGPSEPPFVFDEIYGPLVSLWQRERPGPTIKIYRLGE